MEIKLMSDEEVAALLAKIAAETNVEKLVKLYLKLRTGKSAIAKHAEAVDDQFKQVMKNIGTRLLAKADEQGTTGFQLNGIATTYTAEETKISIADHEAFTRFVLEQKDLGFFQQRVGEKHVQEYMKLHEGAVPPGLSLFRERVMRVRKAGEKP